MPMPPLTIVERQRPLRVEPSKLIVLSHDKLLALSE